MRRCIFVRGNFREVFVRLGCRVFLFRIIVLYLYRINRFFVSVFGEGVIGALYCVRYWFGLIGDGG